MRRTLIGLVLGVALSWAAQPYAQVHVQRGFNAVGGGFTLLSGVLQLQDGTAAAPSLTFTNALTSGLHLDAAGTQWMATSGGTDVLWFSNAPAIRMRNDGSIQWSNVGDLPGTADLIVLRNSANTIELRNGANAQSQFWDETFTDTSNYERGEIVMGTNTMTIRTGTAGTGSDDLDIALTPSGAGNVRIGGGAVVASVSGMDGSLLWPVLRATTSVTLTTADAMVASLTYTGPISITLPSPTAYNRRVLTVHDQAGLAVGTSNRTITIVGAINGGNNTTITTAFGIARLIGGVSSGSSYQFFTW